MRPAGKNKRDFASFTVICNALLSRIHDKIMNFQSGTVLLN
jgi:hypothetical protein